LNSTASAILELAAEMGRTHPKGGWDEVNRLTGFHVTIMAMTGNAGGNLVDCLAAVGLDRDDVVDAFVLAKPRVMAKGKVAKGAAQAAPIAAPKPVQPVQAEKAPPSPAPQVAPDAPKMAAKGLVQPAKATPPTPKPAAAPARPAARVKTDTQPTLF
jgi:hypothetical protein